MFGYTIIKTERIDTLEEIETRVMMLHRWLSGFRDLEVIWDWIYMKSPYRSADDLRGAYAKERLTNHYGKPVDIVRLEEAERIVDLVRRDPLLIEHESQKLAERYRMRYEAEPKTIRRK
jgi:hypothetical protein